MLSDDDETPAVIPFPVQNGRTPAPLPTPRPLVTPPPVVTPRPALMLKKPPFARPAGSLTISELVERVTNDVQRATTGALEQRHAELRAEVGAEIKTATSFGLAAVIMNALAIVTVVVELAFSRLLPARSSALALAAITAVFASALKLGARRTPPTATRSAPR
jgi:hypothetical protein